MALVWTVGKEHEAIAFKTMKFGYGLDTYVPSEIECSFISLERSGCVIWSHYLADVSI